LTKKAQASLEALVSFAALLSALAILLLASQSVIHAFSESVEISRQRKMLSYSVLSIDTAAGALSGSQLSLNISAVPVSQGTAIASKENPSIREPLFHKVSMSQQGILHVENSQKKSA